MDHLLNQFRGLYSRIEKESFWFLSEIYITNLYFTQGKLDKKHIEKINCEKEIEKIFRDRKKILKFDGKFYKKGLHQLMDEVEEMANCMKKHRVNIREDHFKLLEKIYQEMPKLELEENEMTENLENFESRTKEILSSIFLLHFDVQIKFEKMISIEKDHIDFESELFKNQDLSEENNLIFSEGDSSGDENYGGEDNNNSLNNYNFLID